MRGRPKPRKGSDMLSWRSRQDRGEIMSPETFQEIMQKAMEAGHSKTTAKRIAGRAYWEAVEKQWREAMKRKNKD